MICVNEHLGLSSEIFKAVDYTVDMCCLSVSVAVQPMYSCDMPQYCQRLDQVDATAILISRELPVAAEAETVRSCM